MKKSLKRWLCGLLSIVILFTAIPPMKLSAEEAIKYPYTLFAASNKEGAISINAYNTCINGNIATNGTIENSGNLNINGIKKENAKENMIFISNMLDLLYFSEGVDTYITDFCTSDTNINLNNSMKTDGNVSLTGNVNINAAIKAVEDITVNGQTMNANNSIFYSAKGDIKIISDNVSFTGLIYVPYGNVEIEAQNVNLNNVIVIAQSITINCSCANINYNENMARIVGAMSDSEESKEVTDTDASEESEEVTDTDAPEDEEATGTNAPKEKYISIDTSTFFYDSENDIYYLCEKLNQLNGTINNLNGIEYGKWIVKDLEENILSEGMFTIALNWSIKDMGLILGENIIEVFVTCSDGTVYSDKITLLNLAEENMTGVSIDLEDPDQDSIPNYLEERYATNSDNPDTDDDGISDYVEIVTLGTNPTEKDSDGNGIMDGDEDADGDSLTNVQELRFETELLNIDTDGDTLNDSEELNIGTNPLNVDTDSDTMTDDFELNNGYNPVSYNSPTQVITRSYDSADFGIGGTDIDMNMELTAPISGQISFEARLAETELINPRIAGYIGEAYDFTMSGEFQSAAVTFTFDEALLEQENFVPTVYYLNEETQILEEVSEQIVNGNSVTAQLEHFSVYVLLNKTELEAVWNTDIKKPDGEDGAERNLNIAFVIDTSGSMRGSRLSTVKTVMNSFIKNLGENDRAAVIEYCDSAFLLQGLTADKEALIQKINQLYATGGTSIQKGIEKGMNHLIQDEDSEGYDTIILITDGQDYGFNSYWRADAAICVENQIVAYSIGIGSGVSSVHLTNFAEATGGKYYHADVVNDLQEQFEEIKGETIDYNSDSNGDGITDYYTKLICEGKLTTSTGEKLFPLASYEEVQANDDFDEDGIKNGDEIKVTASKYNVYVSVASYPDTAYSDLDVYTDKEELDNGTSPLVSNGIFYTADIDYLTNDDNFVSEEYRELYESDILGKVEKASIWLGNNVFGSDYDKVYTYKCFLISYFENLYAGALVKNEMEELVDLASQLFDDMSNSVAVLGKIDNTEQKECLDNLLQQIKTAQEQINQTLSNGYNPELISKERFYELLDDSISEYQKASQKIPELEKTIKYTESLKKVGDIADSFCVVVDVFSVGIDVYETWDTYNTFSANMDMISQNIYVLDLISVNTSDKNLKAACNEIRQVLKNESELNAQRWEDTVQQIGYKSGRIALEALAPVIAAIPIAGTYIAITIEAVGIIDWITNISDTSKQCIGLYALSSAATYLANDFEELTQHSPNRVNDNGSFKAIYTNYQTVSNGYYNLSILRLTAENQMKETNQERPWYIEWLFTKFFYSASDIEENISKIKSPMFLYKYLGQKLSKE